MPTGSDRFIDEGIVQGKIRRHSYLRESFYYSALCSRHGAILIAGPRLQGTQPSGSPGQGYPKAAWAAASRAPGTRKPEQLT